MTTQVALVMGPWLLLKKNQLNVRIREHIFVKFNANLVGSIAFPDVKQDCVVLIPDGNSFAVILTVFVHSRRLKGTLSWFIASLQMALLDIRYLPTYHDLKWTEGNKI